MVQNEKHPKISSVTGHPRVEHLLQDPESVQDESVKMLALRWHEKVKQVAQLQMQVDATDKQLTMMRDQLQAMTGNLAGIEEAIAMLDDKVIRLKEVPATS
jgi:septal ring factor EnvC (AmiA/AmiB activator)